MLKNLKKLVFVAGAALVCSNGEAVTRNIGDTIEVSVRSSAQLVQPISLLNGGGFRNSGVIMQYDDSGSNQIGHPTGSGDKAAINNFGGVGVGKVEKITGNGVYAAGNFSGIRGMAFPFLDAALFDKTHQKSEGGWGNGSSEIEILDSVTDDGISLVMAGGIPADYNNGGAARVNEIYDLQSDNPNATIDVGSRVNLLSEGSSDMRIDTSDTTLPAFDASHPCGRVPGATSAEDLVHWPVNMGSKVAGADPGQETTILATGGGTVQLEGNNSFYVLGEVQVDSGTTLCIAADTAMPKSDITVGNAADTDASTLTFPTTLADPTTFTAGAGKTITIEKGALIIPDKAEFDASEAHFTLDPGSTVTVLPGATLIL
ncbi:MAG: hypothetical protein K6C34_04930 [Alphaproteobacteria bacterium]|nr:hypothetical protein [Alphaproteobacteria bacterium]